MQSSFYDVIIVGGGTSGLFCAYEAGKKGLKVALIEQRERLGEKLRLAGGGMGNMTNRSLNFSDKPFSVYQKERKTSHQKNNYHAKDANNNANNNANSPTNCSDTHYISHERKAASFLLASLFEDFSCDDVLSLLNTFNIPYEERDFGQIFCLKPVKTLVDLLAKACKNVDFYTNTLVKHIHYTKEEDFTYHVRLEEAKSREKNQDANSRMEPKESYAMEDLITKKLVLATGSTAYPQIGASDFGLRLAKKWGHVVHDFYPVLVPLTLKSFALNESKERNVESLNIDLEGLEGISVPVRMMVSKGKKVFQDPCDVRPLLFTHKGVSGPACLVISCFVATCESDGKIRVAQKESRETPENPEKTIVTIDFLPHVDLLQIMHSPENGKKILKNLLLALLPDRLAYRLMPQELQEKKVAELNKKQRFAIINRFHKAQFLVTKNAGFTKAEAASGGVSVKDVSANLESKLYKGLYFIGEVMDITGLLGGYNIHFALASAKRVVKNW